MQPLILTLLQTPLPTPELRRRIEAQRGRFVGITEFYSELDRMERLGLVRKWLEDGRMWVGKREDK